MSQLIEMLAKVSCVEHVIDLNYLSIKGKTKMNVD